MNIAIASTDGVNVNEHFGKAKEFYIYEVLEDSFHLVKVSQLDRPYSDGTKTHSFDAETFNKVAQKLNMCQKIYCTKIGEAPAQAFKKIGIEPVIYSGPISDIPIDS